MSNSSILGGDHAAARASGRDTDALGPSDNSDSGSDSQGERAMPTGADNPDELGSMPVDLASDSDSMGTGERAAAAGDSGRDGDDILPDHIVGDEAVDSDEAFDVGSAGSLDDIVDEADDDDEEADADVDDDNPDPSAFDRAVGAAAAEPDSDLTGGAPGSGSGRVFRVPAGTLDENGGR